MRAAALILALATSATAFMAPRQAVAPRVAPVNVDASSLVTAYRELYEVGGVQVTADVQQFGPIAGLVVFILAANLGVPSCGGAFTPSTRLVFIRQGRGWFLFRFRGRSDRTAMLRAGEHVVHVHGRFE